MSAVAHASGDGPAGIHGLLPMVSLRRRNTRLYSDSKVRTLKAIRGESLVRARGQ